MSGSRPRTEPARGTLVRKIRALKKTGHSHAEIARRVGCDSQNVDQIVKRWSVRPWWNESNGYVPTSVKPTKQNTEPNRGSSVWKIRKLRRAGKGTEEIARILGITPGCVLINTQRWRSRPWWAKDIEPQSSALSNFKKYIAKSEAVKKVTMPDLTSKYLDLLNGVRAVLDAPISATARLAAIEAILSESGFAPGKKYTA